MCRGLCAQPRPQGKAEAAGSCLSAPGQGQLEAHLACLRRAPGRRWWAPPAPVVPHLPMAQAGETHTRTQDSLGRQGQDRRGRPDSVGAEPSPGARTTRGPGHARAEQVGWRGAFPAPLSHSWDCLHLNTQWAQQAGSWLRPLDPASG